MMTKMVRVMMVAVLAATLTASAGCMGSESGEDGSGTGGGTGGGTGTGGRTGGGTGGTGGTTVKPALPAVSGSFQVVTTIDLTVNAVLPSTAADGVGTLQALKTDPAGTFFDLLEEAGVPLVDDIMDALPSALSSKLKGWINSAVSGLVFNGGPVSTTLSDLIGAASLTLTRFDVLSTLEIGSIDAAGRGLAVHRIDALRFSIQGKTVTVPVPVATGVTTQEDVTIQVSAGRIVIGAHSFSLPYGQYAYDALNDYARQKYGYDLRGALGAAIDCNKVASSVANRCVLGVCVGYQATLRSICEQGLDRAVAEVQSRFAANRFDALELSNGRAAATATALTQGSWDARLDVGFGPRAVPATFTATR